MGIGAAAALVGQSCATDTEADGAKAKSGKKAGPMTTRTNPNTGDVVSLLGYGCMRLPVVNPDAEDDGGIDQEQVNEQVDYALKHGVNYFDTSPAYCKGRSEAAMGIALSRHPRDSYFLATKLSNFAPQTWTAEASKEMFENSLKYLQTDYVDYLLLHAIGGQTEDLDPQQLFDKRYIENGLLDWLEEQKKAGRIRNLGFSYHGDVAVFDRLLREMDEGKRHWDFVQIQHNYIDWNHAKDERDRNTNSSYLYGELEKRGIPAVVMEPLLGGRLANVPVAVAGKMKARRPDDSVASWAFRFAGSQPGILTVLSGMTYMDHIKENVATYSSLDPVTDEEGEFLEHAAMDILLNDNVPCTACAYCMPCPYGVDIPSIFAQYNKSLNEDAVARDKRDPRYEKARKRYLIGMDRVIPKSRQADTCIGCGTCLSHCPQGIEIPTRLQDIAKYTEELRSSLA